MARRRFNPLGVYKEADSEAASLAQGTLAGRGAASGTGVYQQLTLGANLSMAGTVLSAAGGAAPAVASESSFLWLPQGYFHSTINARLLDPSTRVFVCRTWIPFSFKFDQIAFYVTVAGAAGSVIVAGIYSNDGNTKLASSGALAANTIGQKTGTLGVDVTLPAGFYLMAMGSESAGTRPTVSAIQSTPQIWTGCNSLCSGNAVGYAANAIAASALPATLGAITATTNTIPWMILGGSA